MKHIRILLVSLALGALMASLLTTSARASTEWQRIDRCGQLILKNAYLTKNLTCEVGFAFENTEQLRARTGDENSQLSPVTVDLRGHRLQGPATAGSTAFSQNNFPYGGGHPTITNGRIDHWGDGVRVSWTTMTVEKIRLDHNVAAVNCGGYCIISHSILSDNQIGTRGGDSNLVLKRSLLSHNGIGSDAATELSTSSYEGNVYVDNGIGVNISRQLAIADVTKNVFAGNGVGVKIVNATLYEVTLTANTFTHNGDGISIEAHPAGDSENGRADLKGNVAVRNTRYGIYAPGANDLGGNKARGNGSSPPCVGVVCTRP